MSEDTGGAVLGEEALRSIGKVAAELSAAYGVSYGDAIRRLTEVAALVAQARAAGAAEERERIKGLLQRAADGRTEYASSGGPADQVTALRHEANAFTNAVRLCDDLSVMLGLLPSWRWTPEESALSRGSS